MYNKDKCNSYYQLNKEKLKDKSNSYYQLNKEKLTEQKKQKYHNVTESEREKRNEKRRINNVDYETAKRIRKTEWKGRKKMKFDDFETFYDNIFIKASKCQLCEKDITLDGRYNHPNKKVLDHDHISGYIRFVCCHTCNTKMKIRDLIFSHVLLELHRSFNLR
tara:strand:- start:1291 stop:1779 length:489 start_codon:yes stop_codon:yes gene_type:complete